MLNFELDVEGASEPVTPTSELEEAHGQQLTTADSAGELVRTASQKLDELLVGQQEAREERAQLQGELDKLSARQAQAVELLQGELGGLARQQHATLQVAEEIQVSQQEAAAKTLGMLSAQSSQLAKIGETTAATFTALKSLSEHENDVPRLVVITLKDAPPEWKGAWHDNIGSNLLSKTEKWVGTHSFFQLRFLCEKTLLPVDGEAGYELKMPKEGFAEFLKTAGPILSATCAVLKLVTLVGRPVAKIAGIDLPEIGPLDMDGVRDIKLGESTVGEAFEGTGVADMLDQIEALSPVDSGSEPEPEPAPAGGVPEPAPGHGTDLLEFADNAITQVENLATWAGVPLQEEEEEEHVHQPAERLRASVDTIKQWIEKACGEAVPPRDSDLGNHVIGGLQKTVMKDGETLWLSPDARSLAMCTGGQEWQQPQLSKEPAKEWACDWECGFCSPDHDAVEAHERTCQVRQLADGQQESPVEVLVPEPEPGPEPEPERKPEPEPEPREGVPTREFLLMVYKGDDAKMLNTTAASFSELRAKVLARWSCPPEQSWTISLRQLRDEPTVAESFAQLPSPNMVRGKRKTRAMVQIDQM